MVSSREPEGQLRTVTQTPRIIIKKRCIPDSREYQLWRKKAAPYELVCTVGLLQKSKCNIRINHLITDKADSP